MDDTGDDDVVIGPVTYLGAQSWAQETPSASEGGTFFKMGAVLPASTVATVTIVQTTALGAAIVFETGPESGSRSVTYDNCQQNAMVWVGGIVLEGADSGCVTLEVTSSASDDAQQQVRIPLNTTICDA